MARLTLAAMLAVVVLAGGMVPGAEAANPSGAGPSLVGAGVTAGPTMVPSGDLTQPATWSPTGSPYVLTGRLRVMPGGVLTILPGTVVKFLPNPNEQFSTQQLLVFGGQLVANGTAAQPIVFTSGYDDSVGGDSNGDGGATTPHRNDWYNIGFDAQTRADGLAMPQSVLRYAVLKYGGENSGGGCNGYAELAVGAYGRVAVSRSEFLESGSAGVNINPLASDVAVVSVTNSRFADSGCGINASGGDVLNNVFEATLATSAWLLYPKNVTFQGNWLAGYLWAAPDFTPEDANVRYNAFLGVVDRQPSGQNPIDISMNWWGRVLENVAGTCYDYTATYSPPLQRTAVPGSPCYQQGKETVTGYYSNVLPALTSPPPFPSYGVSGGGGGFAGVVPGGQLLGSAESGSVYAARPVGGQADPVTSATGSFSLSAVDAGVAAVGPGLSAARSYSSADTSVGVLGPGWSFGWDVRLALAGPGGGTGTGSTATLRAGDGQQVVFTRQADSSYVGAAGATAALSVLPAGAGLPSGGFQLVTRSHLVHVFDASGRLLRMTDRNGQSTELGYDAGGRLTSAFAPGSGGSATAGRRLTFGWNSGGTRLNKVTLPDGRFVSYTYSTPATGQVLTKVRDLAGRSVTYGYDAGRRVNLVTSPSGATVTRLQYDSSSGPGAGRVTDQWDGKDQHSTFVWTPATGAGAGPGNGTAVMTDARGNAWADVYVGNVIQSRTDPDGGTTSYEYDAKLQLIASSDARGFRSSYGYSEVGDLVSFTGPTRTVVTVFNGDHQPIETISARGTRVTYGYDAAGNPTTVMRPNPAAAVAGAPASTPATLTTTTAYTSDGRGLVDHVTDASGRTTGYGYDATTGDLTSVTDAAGGVTAYGVDTTGRVTSVVEPRGNVAGASPATRAQYTTATVYDDDDQVDHVTDANQHTTSWAYDGDGLLRSVTDANSHTTTYGRDGNFQVSSVQGPDPAIAAAATAYDANHNVASVTDSSGRTISYTYTATNRPKTVTTPLGLYTLGYDKSGNLTSALDPANRTTTWTYTAAGWLLRADLPGTDADVSFTYDANGNRATMSDPAGTSSYTYDALDQLTTVTRGSDTFRYGYDEVGHVTATTYPDGTGYGYGYDAAGRLQDATITPAPPSGASPVTTSIAHYGYDAAGNAVTATLADGSTSTRTIDPAGQLTAIKDVRAATGGGVGATLLNETYTLDNVGNPTKVVTMGTGVADNRTSVNQFDPSDRLTQTCYGSSCTNPADYIAWAYNPDGTIATETRPTTGTPGTPGATGVTTNTYNTTGQLTGSTSPAGNATYGYNSLGQQTTATTPAGSTITSYTGAGLTKTSTTTPTAVGGGGPAATSTSTYDGDGHRLSDTTTRGSTTTGSTFSWNPLTYTLALERDTNGTSQRRYDYAATATGFTSIDSSGTTPTSTRYAYHLDRLGSVRALTSSTGAPTTGYTYEPYGRPKTTTHPNPADPPNPLQWTGQYVDPAPTTTASQGQYHLRARQYDPTTGAFTTPDPASAVAYSATYTYANANPLTGVDPLGLWPSLPSIGDIQQIHDIAATVASITGTGALILGATGIGAPVGAVLGGVSLAAGAVTAASSAYLAYNTCTTGKGPCGAAIAMAAIDTAAALPGGRLARGAAKSGLGDLSRKEARQIQGVVEEAGRPLEVVGSAATGTRRNPGSGFPIGKGPGTQSDIDYLIPPGSLPYYDGLTSRLPLLDRTGVIAGVHNPSIGPGIRFEPGARPRMLGGGG